MRYINPRFTYLLTYLPYIMPQYNTSLFYMYVLNGCQRLDAVVVVSSRVVKIDGAVVWLLVQET